MPDRVTVNLDLSELQLLLLTQNRAIHARTLARPSTCRRHNIQKKVLWAGLLRKYAPFGRVP